MTKREGLNLRMYLAFGVSLGIAMVGAAVALNPAAHVGRENGIIAICSIGATATVLLLWPWLMEASKQDTSNKRG